MRAEKAGAFIIQQLNAGLPGWLSYHNAQHIQDVHDAAKRIGRGEQIGDEEMDLLLVAAWYHDAGFLTYTKGHEEESCRIAERQLPDFGYTPAEIERICGMIRATRLPQTPHNLLEQILADADLDYLGRDDFDEISGRLCLEMKHLGTITDTPAWDRLQIDFLQQHHYFTATAIVTRQAKKETNLAIIKARIPQS